MVEEDIGAIIILLKCQIKILGTTMVTIVTTAGNHHKLFSTIVMALAISNEVVHIHKGARTQMGGSGLRAGTRPVFYYCPNYGKENWKWKMKKFVTRSKFKY